MEIIRDRNRLAYEMIDIGRQLCEKQLIIAAEGNISVRLGKDTFLCTPSGKNKGVLTPSDLVVVNSRGEPLEGPARPTSEIPLHLEVYRNRPDAEAVLHAHPPYCISLMLAGLKLDKPLLPESVLVIGRVPLAPYARPGTTHVAESIRPFVNRTDCIFLDRHGSLTIGGSLAETLLKLEIMEQQSRSYLAAAATGNVLELPSREISELLRLRASTYGFTWPILSYE